MSEDESPTRPGSYKTIGVRLQTPIHAQLSTIAGIDDLSLQVLLVRGAKLLIEAKQAAPDFKDRVTAELKKIEQEAAERRGAIESLFGSGTQADEAVAAEQIAESVDEASTPEVDTSQDEASDEDASTEDEAAEQPAQSATAKKTTRQRASAPKS